MPIPRVEQRQSVRNDPAFLLAILYTIGFFAFLFSLIHFTLPKANEQMIGQLVPVLSMIQGGIIQYFYQKRAEAIAEKKDETIQELTKATTTALTKSIPPVPTPATPSGDVETVNMVADTVNVSKDAKDGNKPPASSE